MTTPTRTIYAISGISLKTGAVEWTNRVVTLSVHMTPRFLISTFVYVCEVTIKNLSQGKGAAKVDAWSKINSKFTKKCMENRTNADICPELSGFPYISL